MRFTARLFSLPVLVAVALAAAVAPVGGQDPALVAQLSRAYDLWRSAMVAQDARAWAAAITTYRQVVTRNLIVSQKKNFPGAVFEVPVQPPEITGLRLLEAESAGETAHLLLFGKVDMGGDPALIPESVFMLKFFQERGGWKFDSSKLLRLNDQPEIARQIKDGGRPEFLDWPDFTPPGKAPAVPKLCAPPEHMAGCTFQTFGYETKLRINGHDYPAMTDHAEKLFVIGGLRTGANELVLEVRPVEIPPGEQRLLRLDFFVLSGREDKPPVRVYHYEDRQGGLTGTLRLPLTLTAEILDKGL
jgi:hypothetical protein